MAVAKAKEALNLVDKEFDYNRIYKFKLTTEHKGNFIIPSSARIWDDYTKRQRLIRYVDIEESPYADEQDEDSIVSSETIQFRKGVLYVSGAQKNKILYLLAYDGNADKEKMLPNRHPLFRYKLVDDAKEFKDKASLRKLKLKIQNALSEATYQELSDFLVSEYNYQAITDEHDELLDEAMRLAEKDPEYVSKNFNTEESQMKAKFIKAFKDQIIKNTKGIITWAETGMEIQSFKLGEDDKITNLMWEWVAKGSKEANDFVKKLALKL